MGTPAPTGAVGGSLRGWPQRPDAADPSPEEGEYVFWYHTGEGSVLFYPPGSVQEHLVTQHGIDSLEVLRKTKGHDHHAREHSGQAGARLGTIGDLLAVGHAHEQAA